MVKKMAPPINNQRVVAYLIITLFLSACTSFASYTQTAGPTPTELARTAVIPSDPYDFPMTAQIRTGLSEDNIAKTLFSRWLDYLLSDNVSHEWRIDEYNIENIEIPADQHCARQSGTLFLAEVLVTLKTTLPMVCTTNCQHSEWAAGSGNINDAYHITKPFNGMVYKSGNVYILRLIKDVPPC